ncbi:MFS transporter [Bradyrhizobium jicamae]|uniref:MFS transporter n=1 Tax=Bradyrhizobium jicamae TaxID=280332 RepID=UPI001BAACA25|nr:MFS transporter [Bradyrhizobium jicamae]MBR0755311.1 MFS transporter [Bradyrhizobium jicamae]
MRAGTESLINVTRLIDDSPVRPIQVVAIVLCSLAAFLDGMDSQSIAIAAPVIAENLTISRAALGPIFSVGALGAAVGALTFGPLGDRLGRKRVLVIAIVTFGLFTLATAYAQSIEALLVVRFCAGLGLGGATPCFITLASEFAPKRRRAMVASLIWAAFPLGGTVGGFINGYILATFGWKMVFLVGGAVPLAIALVLLVWMPESLRFLLARGGNEAAVTNIMRRLGIDLPPNPSFVSDEVRVEGSPLRHLFTERRGLSTLLLWVPFFMTFGTLALAVIWTPLLLRDNGIDPAQAGIVIGIHGIGALIGMSCAGRLAERLGMIYALVPALLLGAMATAAIGYAATAVQTAAMALFLVGLFAGLGASGAIAIATLIYPTAMRSSGVGWAMGMGRTGQVVAPLFASSVVAAGWNGIDLFLALGFAPIVAALAILCLRAVLVKGGSTVGEGAPVTS